MSLWRCPRVFYQVSKRKRKLLGVLFPIGVGSRALIDQKETALREEKMAMNPQILQALQSLSSQLEGVVGRLEKLESTGVSAPGGGAAPAAAPSGGGGGGGDASVVSTQCISALDILVSRIHSITSD